MRSSATGHPHRNIEARWLVASRAAAMTCLGMVIGCQSTPPPKTVEPASPMPGITEAVRDEPEKSLIGSDTSALPVRHPAGSWLPLSTALLAMQLEVPVSVDGVRMIATLDTGASTTVISSRTLRDAGVVLARDDNARDISIRDAHGDFITASVHIANALDLGVFSFTHQRILVVDRNAELFLIGADVLHQVDLVLAADEGIVGVFAAGTAPHFSAARRVDLDADERQLRVAATTANGAEAAAFALIVDTGASTTQIPLRAALKARLRANVTRSEKTAAVGGVRERRGFFALEQLTLGSADTPLSVPRVIAPGTHFAQNENVGLLGNDILLRYRTVIRWSEGAVEFAPLPLRGAQRQRGPGGQPCLSPGGVPVACIDVQPQARPETGDTCVRVRIHPAYSGTTLEMAIVAEHNSAPHFAGGALQAFFTVGDSGVDECVSSLPLDERPVELQLLWVRNEGVQWLCDPLATECTHVTGPLARRSTN